MEASAGAAASRPSRSSSTSRPSSSCHPHELLTSKTRIPTAPVDMAPGDAPRPRASVTSSTDGSAPEGHRHSGDREHREAPCVRCRRSSVPRAPRCGSFRQLSFAGDASNSGSPAPVTAPRDRVRATVVGVLFRRSPLPTESGCVHLVISDAREGHVCDRAKLSAPSPSARTWSGSRARSSMAAASRSRVSCAHRARPAPHVRRRSAPQIRSVSGR
jgi:hypothetical protein